MELLKKLTEIYAPSGKEERISDFIAGELKPYADEIYTDSLGNLIVHKKGDGKKILLASHIDEIGLFVNYVDDNGFVRFSPIGGVMPHCALYQSVVFENGTRGVVAYEEKTDVKKDLDLSHMYIDIGAQTAEEASKIVRIGDCAVFEGAFGTNGDYAFSKAMDNRAGVYVLMTVLKNIGSTANDLYFAFTVQEEIGCRGAKVCANSICPDVALAVDVTDTGDTPECKRMSVKLGQGPCIKYMDDSIITHKEVNDALRQSAENIGVKVQHEVLSFGGTDAGAIHTSGIGVKTGAVSIPTRYIHTPVECVSLSDLDGAVKLITDFVTR